jgi:heptosyltransferase I
LSGTVGKRLQNRPRILIIKMSSLGDLFHALPAVRCLKTGLGADVDWVIQPEYADLIGCFPDVTGIIPFPRRDFGRRFVPFTRALRRSRYDLILDFQGLLKSAFVARLARGSRRIGPSFSREGSRLFYDAVAGPRNKDRHAVDEIMDFVRHLGVPVPALPEFPVVFPNTPRLESPPRVAILPSSRWATKNWQPERFAEVARALVDRAGATVFLTGAPADQQVCEQIEELVPRNIVNQCGQTSLVELGSLLQEMTLAVSVDSGPMHMAAAIGTPVLAVFGATNPRRTGPYGGRHRVITVDHLGCRPCLLGDCSRRDIACLNELPSDRVIAAALEMLGR